MRTAQRVITAFVVVLAMFGLGTTAAHAGSAKTLAAAHAGSAKTLAASWALIKFQRSTKYANANLWWDLCETAGQRVIFLEKYPTNCGEGGSAGNVWGSSALITNSSSNHVVKVCQPYHSGAFSEVIDQANSSGGSTGILHTYSDSLGGGCTVVTITYPVRKFQASWGGESSFWALPY